MEAGSTRRERNLEGKTIYRWFISTLRNKYFTEEQG